MVGGLLAAAGHRVTLIARGAHLEALQGRGLVLEEPGSTRTLRLEAVGHPSEVASWEQTTVLLTMKSQDTAAALGELAAVCPPETPVACLQNGVDNERMALRFFGEVVGACVVCAATYVRPGVVQAHSDPARGVFELGPYPSGTSATAGELADALNGAGFDAAVHQDVMRWKYAKLLTNLGNAVEVLCGPEARTSDLARAARQEGRAVLVAAGIDVATPAEEKERRARVSALAPTASGPHRGGSSWQGAVRGSRGTETPYLNGEITLLGRLHGIPTPVNQAILHLTTQMIGRGQSPGTIDPGAVLAAAGVPDGSR